MSIAIRKAQERRPAAPPRAPASCCAHCGHPAADFVLRRAEEGIRLCQACKERLVVRRARSDVVPRG